VVDGYIRMLRRLDMDLWQGFRHWARLSHDGDLYEVF
jgi:hypothetical protein